MTLAQTCKSYGFKTVPEVADKIGVTTQTMRIWNKNEVMRENVLIPHLERLRKVQK